MHNCICGNFKCFSTVDGRLVISVDNDSGHLEIPANYCLMCGAEADVKSIVDPKPIPGPTTWRWK